VYCGFEGSKEKERKHGRIECTVVPNVEVRNAGFLGMNDLLNVFSLDPAVSYCEKYCSVGVKMRGAVLSLHDAVPNA
jgi:hypothetical protein